MSGGYYNYLYCRIDSLIDREYDLEEMANDLADLGYAYDAALATGKLISKIRQFKKDIIKNSESLSEVWKAMEYWRSGDWGEDSLKEALDKYREGKE